MKASIIITSYNYAQYIERSIRSCLSQKFPEDQFEVIVVDDASTDNTIEILEKFSSHKNFRYILNEKNVGVAESANSGIKACFGRYFIRVDADDYIHDQLLFLLSFYLEANHDAFCVSCDYWLVDEFENKIKRKYAETDPVSCGIMYRTDLILKHGLYDPRFRHREEEELRHRLAEYYRAHHLRLPLYRYRMHDSNKTKDTDALAKYFDFINELHSPDAT